MDEEPDFAEKLIYQNVFFSFNQIIILVKLVCNSESKLITQTVTDKPDMLASVVAHALFVTVIINQ